MSREQLKSVIESILFAWSDAVHIKDFVELLQVSREELKIVLEEMVKEYQSSSRGIRLMEIDGSYQLSTKPENYEYIQGFVKDKNEKNLSKPALETLSIIAYKQPVTKIEIEELRGVKCDSALKGLMDLGLITISGTLDRIGHPNLYCTTEEFLRKFGISSLKELPKLEELLREEE